METSYSLENKNSSAKPEFPCILLKPTFHYTIYKSSPILPTMSQINPVPLSHPLLTELNLTIKLPSTPWSSNWTFSQRFTHQILECISPLSTACHMSCPSLTSCFDHSYDIRLRIHEGSGHAVSSRPNTCI
jgi:hypothetical protein